ncbi:MAG: hypothetical protein ACI4WH_08195 [Oscillospiraceae bacterium]
MISLKEAFDLVQNKKPNCVIFNCLENNDSYIFGCGILKKEKSYNSFPCLKDGKRVYIQKLMEPAILVDKQTATIKKFFLPNKENFTILDSSKNIDISHLNGLTSLES